MDNFLISTPSWTEMITAIWFSEATTQLSLFIKTFKVLCKDIEAIKINLSKSWWELLLDNQLIAVILGFLLALIPQWWMGRRKKLGKIKAALASFENTRVTLLMFKGDYVTPYRDDMRKIFKCIENAAIKLKLPTQDKMNDSHLSNNQIMEMIRDDWKMLYFPFRFSNNLVFYTKSWAETLSFVANHVPEYLITFHKSYEYLQELNQRVQDKNMITSESRKMPVDSLSYGQLGDAIHINNDISNTLEELINISLAMNQLSIDHLNEYTRKHFWLSSFFGFNNFFNFKLKMKHNELMPKIEDCLETYPQQIQESINERTKQGSCKHLLNLLNNYFTKKK